MSSNPNLSVADLGSDRVSIARAGLAEQLAIPVAISSLSKRLGVTARTLRFYEIQGLVTSGRCPRRGRLYDAETVETLELIISLRKADVSIDEIRRLLAKRATPSAFTQSVLDALRKKLSFHEEQARLLRHAIQEGSARDPSKGFSGDWARDALA